MRQFFYYELDYTDDNALTTSADFEHSLAVQKPASLVVINPSILFILSTNQTQTPWLHLFSVVCI